MSTTPVTHLPPAERRVRHQARDVLALMGFSAAVSTGFALCLLLLASLVG